MDPWDELRKYRVGRDRKGNSVFRIPLESDKDGFIGRECPNSSCSPKYFKISMELPDGRDEFPRKDLTCPYCSRTEAIEDFVTEAQKAHILSLAQRDAIKGMTRELEKLFRPLNRSGGGSLGVQVTVKPSPLPQVRRYVEEDLKQVCLCSSCQIQYAVYGVAFQCPLCGKGAFDVHITKSAETIRTLVQLSADVGREHGVHIRDAMLGDAAENVVSLFEGHLKKLYAYGIENSKSAKESRQLLRKVGTSFQRLPDAERMFARDLEIEILNAVTPEDLSHLEQLFAKRHVVTHSLGLADAKYRERVGTKQREDREIDIDAAEIERAVSIAEAILLNTSQLLGVAQSRK